MTDSPPGAEESRANGRAALASAVCPGLGEAFLGYPVRAGVRLFLAVALVGASVLLLAAAWGAIADLPALLGISAILFLLMGAILILTVHSVRFCLSAVPLREAPDGCLVLAASVSALAAALVVFTPLLAYFLLHR